MIAHVQNPWTRSPQLFVHMTVEEVQQACAALRALESNAILGLTGNQADALLELKRTLEHALLTERPRGIKGVMP